MPWILHLPDRDVNTETDIPLQVWAEIEKETGVSWFDAAARPLSNAWVAVLLAQKAAAHVDVEVPPLTAASVFKVFEFVPETPEDFPTSGSPTDGAADSQPEADTAPTST